MGLGAISRAASALALTGAVGCFLDLDALTAGSGGGGGMGGGAGSTSTNAGGEMGGMAGMGGIAGMGGEAGAGNMATGDLRVDYAVTIVDPVDNTLKPKIIIINTSLSAVALGDVKVRYWYTLDSVPPTEQLFCDNSSFPVACGDVVGTFGDPAPPRPTADRYVEVSFTGTTATNTLAPNGGSAQAIHLRVQSFAGNFDEANDYSYGANLAFEEGPKITAYLNDVLAWGEEPMP